jgi:hypothetical protein
VSGGAESEYGYVIVSADEKPIYDEVVRGRLEGIGCRTRESKCVWRRKFCWFTANDDMKRLFWLCSTVNGMVRKEVFSKIAKAS